MDMLELARKRAEAAEVITQLGIMNTPTKPEDRVKADVRYKIAWDAFSAADRAYHQAIAGMNSDELSELART